ncbi:hypothetical protein J7438_08295 [Thalassotalea sp. G20_0]|uniref:hypothetical protein n=1 Tax=Thalassotalea sp. G20_0 TaxID=2821093 RepID=UPI001ADBCD90|nr:hypothetical protein [Thalassotalea sp. G20_0]MBO9494084.1 hypothetical protein [Thalassotalea sp. G20_0]
MDIRAGTSSLTENHQAPGSDKNFAEVKGSKNISSPSCFSGRDVEVTAQKRLRDSTCDPLPLTKIAKTMAETDVLSGKIEPLHVKQHTTVSFQSPISSSVVSGQPSQIPARKMPSSHSLLLSPKELTDQIRLKTYEELKACKTLPVFYVSRSCQAVRLTESAKQRMYDDGLSTDDVNNALHLTTGKSALNQIPPLSFDRFYYIANHKVIVHLMKYAENNIFKPTVFKPGIDVFEYFDEYKQQWLPAEADRSFDYPEPLIDPRYIQIEEIQHLEVDKILVTTDDEKYLADKVAECLTGTFGVICHTLHSPMPDSEKVAFLSDLINPETTTPSPEDDSVECGGMQNKRLSATEFLTRIRYAP